LNEHFDADLAGEEVSRSGIHTFVTVMTGSHSFDPIPQTMDVTSEIKINCFAIANRCTYLLVLESTKI